MSHNKKGYYRLLLTSCHEEGGEHLSSFDIYGYKDIPIFYNEDKRVVIPQSVCQQHTKSKRHFL